MSEPLQARLRELAEKIVDGLFTNGQKRRADRLLLLQERSGHAVDLGGWCPEAATDQIELVLRTALAGVSPAHNYLEGASNAMRLAAIGTEQARKDWEDYKAASPAGVEQEKTQALLNAPPFVDTPVLQAKRRAFDNPTQANLDALIAAVKREASSSAPAAGEGWQAIETAPEADGLMRVNMLVAAESGRDDASLVVGEVERDDDGNFWWANEVGDYHASPITHRARFWRPMPDPPLSAVPRRDADTEGPR